MKNAFCPISQLLLNRFISFFQNKNSEKNVREFFVKTKSVVYTEASETGKPVLKTGFFNISPHCMNWSCRIPIAKFSKAFPIVWHTYYICQLSVGFINAISTDTRTDGRTWSNRHRFLQGFRKYKLFCSPTKIVEITNGMTNLYIPFTPVVKGIIKICSLNKGFKNKKIVFPDISVITEPIYIIFSEQKFRK